MLSLRLSDEDIRIIGDRISPVYQNKEQRTKKKDMMKSAHVEEEKRRGTIRSTEPIMRRKRKRVHDALL